MGARARLDRGQLFACLAPRLHARDLPKLFARALEQFSFVRSVRLQADHHGPAKAGHYVLVESGLMGRAGPDVLQSFVTSELAVETLESYRIRVALDGEVAMLTAPLAYIVRPRALKVLVPGG
jgi:hypothetical protein